MFGFVGWAAIASMAPQTRLSGGVLAPPLIVGAGPNGTHTPSVSATGTAGRGAANDRGEAVRWGGSKSDGLGGSDGAGSIGCAWAQAKARLKAKAQRLKCLISGESSPDIGR